MPYKVFGFDSYDKYFDNKKAAEKYKQEKKKNLHECYCVSKKDMCPEVTCLCITSDGKKMCANHHYQKLMGDHELADCNIASLVMIEKIEIIYK